MGYDHLEVIVISEKAPPPPSSEILVLVGYRLKIEFLSHRVNCVCKLASREIQRGVEWYHTTNNQLM